jgi:hypothetical protein
MIHFRNKMIENSTILLMNEDDDGYGYTILQHEMNSIINVMYWAKDTETKTVSFLDMKDFYEKSSVYIRSDLANINPLHRAKYKMCAAFINYFGLIS